MGFILATLKKDVARWRQDYSSFLIWLAIPFLIGGLITLMIDGGNGGGPSGTLLIHDQDETLLSGFVASAFAQDQLGEIFTVQQVTAEEGTTLVNAGEASAFLTIPTGFQDALLNNTPVSITLKTNPSQTILPGIVETVSSVLLDAAYYLRAVFSDEIDAIMEADADFAPSNAFIAGISVDINEKIEALGSTLSPIAFDLEIVEPPPTEPRPDIGLLFMPGIVLMALLFSAQGLSADYWQEREKGTLRRLVSSPGSLQSFVIGKAIAALAVMAFVVGVTLLVGFLYHGVQWEKFLPSLLWVLVAGVGFFAWFAALQMLFSTRQGANLLTTILLFPLLMMGGSFFPLDTLPDWLAAIGRMSPNGFVADRLTDELTSATAWSFDTGSWFIVIAMTLSGLLISAWRLGSGFARR